ncbi:histidine kinase dimerization/phospho-acceptor domain-containing protein [Sphingomonas sp.]|uniref:sensor histidine kinase n=1 Tax=Sphingomonas sp. TaxID=28214 RepID=UPI0025CE1CBE|nr:histidine kinase dimerization/phospho-acceptor domain-containing protein [Sphingomonas sp.]
MRFNDSLETVLAADTSTRIGAELAWRQLVDLVGRRRTAAVERAMTALETLRPRVSAAARAAAARAIAFADPPAPLVRLIAGEPIGVAAPVLRSARLSDAEWCALLPEIGAAGRAVLRHRRDLSNIVAQALAAYGPVDFVLGASPAARRAAAVPPATRRPEWRDLLGTIEQVPGEPALEAAPLPSLPEEPFATEPAPAPALESTMLGDSDFASFASIAASLPAVQAALRNREAAPEPTPSGPFPIAEVVARIDAFQRQREANPAPAPRLPPEHFHFETDARGVIRWVEGAERTPLIGVSLEYGAGAAAAVDGVASGAFRRRARFDDARLVIAGRGELAGAWRISGVPVFERESGRFTGYRGAARRPRADERAEPAAPAHESLRALVHELRTPTNAIAGFAEMIEGEMIGPVPAPYRGYAATIVDQARALLGAIEDLDTAARIDAHALELRPGEVAIAPLITRLLADLAPLAALRGAATTFKAEPELAARADDRALERLLGRLLAVLVAALGRGETLPIAARRQEGELLIEFGRPAKLALDEAAPAADAEAEVAAGMPLLGTGFALRLARNLARELGGALSIEPLRLTLQLPAAFAADMGQASIN